MKTLITQVLLYLLQFVLRYLGDYLSPEMLKRLADKALDFVEDLVTKTNTELDDAIVLALCAAIREAFDIPDLDAKMAAARRVGGVQ